MNGFLLTFIPIFVAMDAIATLPLFISFTKKLSAKEKHRLTWQAVITAFAVAVSIVFTGKSIFNFLGITVNDFRIAGGTILLILAVKDLVFPDDKSENADTINVREIGVVPLGIPLIIGPGVLTTLIILIDTHGYPMTLLSLVLNLVIVFVLFYYSDVVSRVLGKKASMAFAKVANLFMAAIAIMMIRIGILDVMSTLNSK
jgi:multiple antibiotic resistance protein